MNTDDLKLCKDCDHFRLNKDDKKYSKCGNTIELVFGEPAEYCEVERKARMDNRCGPEGKYFTKKKVQVE